MILAVAHWPEALVDAFELLTELGHSAKYVATSALAFVLFRWIVRRPQPSHAAALVFGAIVLPGLLINLLKVVVGRLRPHRLVELQEWGFMPLTADYDASSFPSGHSSTIFGLAVAFSFLMPRLRALWFTIAGVVAFSRVVVLAHYPSDTIIGGYIGVLLATTWAAWLERGQAAAPRLSSETDRAVRRPRPRPGARGTADSFDSDRARRCRGT